jgi:hypothetical protein
MDRWEILRFETLKLIFGLDSIPLHPSNWSMKQQKPKADLLSTVAASY